MDRPFSERNRASRDGYTGVLAYDLTGTGYRNNPVRRMVFAQLGTAWELHLVQYLFYAIPGQTPMCLPRFFSFSSFSFLLSTVTFLLSPLRLILICGERFHRTQRKTKHSPPCGDIIRGMSLHLTQEALHLQHNSDEKIGGV